MLCVASLALAALGPWTYAGFLAEPSPPPPPPSPTVSSPAPPPIPSSRPEADSQPSAASVESEVFPRLEVETPRAKKPEPEPPVAPSSAPPAIQYRMADLGGQVWEHPDPTWLRTFVLDRNRRFFGSR